MLKLESLPTFLCRKLKLPVDTQSISEIDLIRSWILNVERDYSESERSWVWVITLCWAGAEICKVNLINGHIARYGKYFCQIHHCPQMEMEIKLNG